MTYRGWQLKNLPPENPTWGITEIIVTIVFYILFKYLFNLTEPISIKLLTYFKTDLQTVKILFYILGIIISNLLTFLLVIFLVKKRYSTIKELGFTWINLLNGFSYGFIASLIICFVVIGIGMIFGNLFGIHEHTQLFTKNFLLAKSVGIKGLFYLIAIFLIPIAQAILFQGFLYPAIRVITGKGLAFILVGAIYAACFFDLQRALQLFMAGFILTYIYEESGNIFAPILANSIWQGIMLWLISVTSWK